MWQLQVPFWSVLEGLGESKKSVWEGLGGGLEGREGAGTSVSGTLIMSASSIPQSH